MIFGLFLLVTLMCCITSIEIKPDNPQSGIAFVPYELVNLQESTKYLAYNFNLSSMEYIFTSYSHLENVCKENRTLADMFQYEIGHNILWNNTKLTPKIDKSDIYDINIKFSYNILLDTKINMFNLKRDRSKICNNFQELVSHFILMNRRLNELSNLNTSAILGIFYGGHIMEDIGRLLKNHTAGNLFYPFEKLQYFPTNFFDFVKVRYYYSNYQVTIMFLVPLYRQHMLYKIFPKPIAATFSSYVLNTDMKYAFLLNKEPIFYSDLSFKENCFRSDSQTYCKKSNDIANCENKVVKNILADYVCLTRLPQRNVITQVGRSIYFTIFEPMIVQFNCNKGMYLVQMTSHSKIIDNFDCSINKSSFRYSPNHDNLYRIHIVKEDSSKFLKGSELWNYFEICWLGLGTFSFVLYIFRYARVIRDKIKELTTKRTSL